MTLEQMREFLILAEERNYLVAADMLYSTQATLSRHIMAMEDELGFQLFSRSTRKIQLTPEGARFLPYARSAVRIQDAYKAAIEQARQIHHGHLRVGYSPMSTFYHITENLTSFIAKNPDVEIKIWQGNNDELLKAVQEGNLELAFLQENPFEKPRNVDFVRLETDILVAVLPKSHPLARRDSIELNELANESFVFANMKQEPATIILEACRRSGFEPNILSSGIVGHAMYDWVMNSSGVAADWREPALTHAGNRLVLVPVEPPLYSNTLVIYKKENLSAPGKTLIRYFEKHSTAKEMIEP